MIAVMEAMPGYGLAAVQIGIPLRLAVVDCSDTRGQAVRMANPVAVAMHHDPPVGLPPELFLVCVASAYQIRHGGPGAVWSAPGWPGYGMPKGWGFPPGFNGIMPAPPMGALGGYGQPGWGAPPPGPMPGGASAPTNR